MDSNIILSILVAVSFYIAYVLTMTMRKVVDLHESKKLDNILYRISEIEKKINSKYNKF